MERRCLCCCSRFIPSRNKNQRYCNKSDCQRKRRSSHQKQKLKGDADYKDTHKASQKKWREKNPSYWRLYRSRHPAYVDNNRKQQTARDHKLKTYPFKQNLPIPCFDVNGTLFARKTHCLDLANMYSLKSENYNFSYNYAIFLPEKNILQICTR